ncbi:MAG: hypothetical protein WCE68_00960 [Anaerolineales bacterium]
MLTVLIKRYLSLSVVLLLSACAQAGPALSPQAEPPPLPSLSPSPSPSAAPTALATGSATASLRGPTWQPVVFPFGFVPPSRIEPALTLDTRNKIALLFGGFHGNDIILNDLWETDGKTVNQIQVSPSPMLRNAGMAYDEKRQVAVLFGTGENTKLSGETWLFDGAEWVQQHPLNSPSTRLNACMAYDAARDQTVLFGGAMGTGAEAEKVNDTWVWDGADWKQVFPTSLPPAREWANMVYDRARQAILLFGGASGGGLSNNTTLLDDTWVWDGTRWVEQHPDHHPPAREDFGMAYDENRQQVILFGGDSGYSTLIDTWAWDGQDWQQLQTIQSPPQFMSLISVRMVYLPSLDTVMLYGSSFDEGKFWELVYK